MWGKLVGAQGQVCLEQTSRKDWIISGHPELPQQKLQRPSKACYMTCPWPSCAQLLPLIKQDCALLHALSTWGIVLFSSSKKYLRATQAYILSKVYGDLSPILAGKRTEEQADHKRLVGRYKAAAFCSQSHKRFPTPYLCVSGLEQKK